MHILASKYHLHKFLVMLVECDPEQLHAIFTKDNRLPMLGVISVRIGDLEEPRPGMICAVYAARVNIEFLDLEGCSSFR